MATDLDLCFITGTEAVQAFKARKLSPVELMKAIVARCEDVNPKLNAITYRFFERALAQAKDAEKHYVSSPGNTLPLEGLPVAIKDFTQSRMRSPHSDRKFLNTIGQLYGR